MTKKHTFPLLTLLLISTSLLAQPFDIGHTTVALYDSSRSRNIEAEIYYPADTPGDDVAMAVGSFPVLVFGHGFVMNWASYENFWAALVPEGYVMCFPTTEMGLSPSHDDFGLDLRFIAAQMQAEHQDSSSLFFQSLLPKTAFMGHSMGGGASFLAAENDTTISALVNFAAAETTPSAIAAADHITAPALLFSGDDDCVTPPMDHQDPLYNALASACKTHVSIVNGGHCYFAESNFSCTLGETFCNPTLDITREAQHDITFDFLKLWLAFALYDQPQALGTFNDSLATSIRINALQNCNSTAIQQAGELDGITLFPNPVTDRLYLKISPHHPQGVLIIYNQVGEKVHQEFVNQREHTIDITSLSPGTYIAVWVNDSLSFSSKFIKNR